MITKVKVRKLGESFAVIVPKAIAEELQISQGEPLFFCKGADGRYFLTRSDPETNDQLQIARKGIVKYRNTLQKLG